MQPQENTKSNLHKYVGFFFAVFFPVDVHSICISYGEFDSSCHNYVAHFPIMNSNKRHLAYKHYQNIKKKAILLMKPYGD